MDNVVVWNGVGGIAATAAGEVPAFITQIGHNDVWDNGFSFQGQAWLAVDLYVVAGSSHGFVPEEVEVGFFGPDGSRSSGARIPAAEFRM